MAEVVRFARYGLLMAGQPLERHVTGVGESKPAYFWGTLFEGRQQQPLPNGAVHYPVAILQPAKVKIRCQICFQTVEDPFEFWHELFETEMFYPSLSAEHSMMLLRHTNVFLDSGEVINLPLFVLNPLFPMFFGSHYGMQLSEIPSAADGFASWRSVAPWKPT